MQRKIHKRQKPDWDRILNHRELYNAYRGIQKPRHTNLHGGSFTPNPYKILCLRCRVAFKVHYIPEVCAMCGNDVILIAPRVRVPRKTASNKQWGKFTQTFTRNRR